jgi:beta-phosphoglucomutase-like phosphatase (HAD superfamily)/dTDP-glucose pyrophosphorylase
MIDLIIFDLDGVLVEAKKIHFDALNDAISIFGPEYTISWAEHLDRYDGLKTQTKLEMLSKEKGLPVSLYKDIWNKKQEITLLRLNEINKNLEIFNCVKELSDAGYKIACCSNSIRKTVYTVLSRLGIISFFDLILSNEDVPNAKPHPEIYWKAISTLGTLPEKTLIVEDSPYGLLAAERTGSNILRVKSPNEVNIQNLTQAINSVDKKTNFKWIDKKMNIVIPMAGAGSRFRDAGYTFPKPLIEVKGKPMIQVVVENINIDANYVFIVQKNEREKYNLDTLLNLIAPNCAVIETDGLTEGAACTALLSKEFINNEDPLFFANSDQFVEWNSSEFLYNMQESQVDGGIVSFRSTHPKWSFAKVDESGFVTEVAEKNPISDIATVGFYYWKHGSDFVKYAEDMISNNIRVNNEFYVCPVFNQAIKDGKKIKTFDISKMWGLGTPEDLDFYLREYRA